ncbi:MAG: hypothetical protein R3327_00815 [Nitrosopumilaceae archaeon]|nr:hypothetical protein [Nitrosopumilaceae archaeon]
MGKGAAYGVFILPVIFTIVFSGAVMVGALDELERDLNMLYFMSDEPRISHQNDIVILGLQKQYSTSEPVQIQVQVDDESFECGDLYITIHSKDKSVITQSGFFSQCYGESGILPLDDRFSEIIADPGNYEVVVELKDTSQRNTLSASEKFTVK